MNAFKTKSKPGAKSRSVPSPFVAKAQQTAARENARFGLPLIVQAAD
jgi:hypothetical protein